VTRKNPFFISIIIVTRNVMGILPECISRIQSQNYDKNLIEVLLIDGGSVDGTLNYAERNNIRVIDGGFPDNQEARRYVGAKYASGEVLLYLDADNLIPDKEWLKRMITPFNDEKVVCSFTKWYGIEDSLSFVDRYYALLGGNDPVAYYLGKHDRVPYGCYILPHGSKLIYKEKDIEYVKFSHDRLPTLGCNGFLAKKSYFDKLNYKSPNMFYHTDVHVELIMRNPEALYAIVPTTITHATGSTLIRNLKKRLMYKRIHSDKLSKYRKYKVFDSKSRKDMIKIVVIIIRGLTVIEPLLFSIIRYYKTNRIEWLMHPVATFSMICIYGYGVLTNFYYKRKR
jgi:glycosyltransferase involved in cell wall biosynthesis